MDFWAGFHKQASRHAKRVESAIKNRADIHIKYKKLNGRVVHRKVTPYEIKAGLLIGHDHKRGEIRSYKLDRMQAVKNTK